MEDKRSTKAGSRSWSSKAKGGRKRTRKHKAAEDESEDSEDDASDDEGEWEGDEMDADNDANTNDQPTPKEGVRRSTRLRAGRYRPEPRTEAMEIQDHSHTDVGDVGEDDNTANWRDTRRTHVPGKRKRDDVE